MGLSGALRQSAKRRPPVRPRQHLSHSTSVATKRTVVSKTAEPQNILGNYVAMGTVLSPAQTRSCPTTSRVPSEQPGSRDREPADAHHAITSVARGASRYRTLAQGACASASISDDAPSLDRRVRCRTERTREKLFPETCSGVPRAGRDLLMGALPSRD